jgi:hypothetical protein
MRSCIGFIPGELKLISSTLLRLSSCAVLSTAVLFIIFSGCSEKEPVRPDNAATGKSSTSLDSYSPQICDFAIKAKYRKIRSYPEGGGVFIVRALPAGNPLNEIILSIEADPGLNALIDLNDINQPSGIAEITIRPEQSIEFGTYPIKVYATRSNSTRSIKLDVETINWTGENVEMATVKKDEFIDWLETEHPEFGTFSGREWFPYVTYPGILVVEHWTFLDPDWEMRICFHVMIPPYDWSMILLRPRGEWDPIFAAKRESDGTIYEIPIDEYPIFFSY